MDDITQSYDNFLNPETLKRNLVAASVFLTAFEFLRDALISQPKCFFSEPSKMMGQSKSEDYCREVRALDKREDVACALWFVRQGALDDADLKTLRHLTDHRNEIAHELSEHLDRPTAASIEHLNDICDLVKKIDGWWIREMELPCNPDFDHVPLNETEVAAVTSGRAALLPLLVQIAKGDDSAFRELYEAWRVSR